MLTRYDRILIYFLLFLVAASFLAVALVAKRYVEAKEAVVFLRGREVLRMSLNQSRKTFRVAGCLIEIARGRVRVASSTCPNKICISAGWISQPSQIIVCAPQRVVVKIGASSLQNAVDAVTR
jgi:hypothetical protein